MFAEFLKCKQTRGFLCTIKMQCVTFFSLKAPDHLKTTSETERHSQSNLTI